MKALLWKCALFVPLGALVCYFILSHFPGLEQIEAEQKTQRAISAARANSSNGKLSAAAVLAIDPKPAVPVVATGGIAYQCSKCHGTQMSLAVLRRRSETLVPQLWAEVGSNPRSATTRPAKGSGSAQSTRISSATTRTGSGA